jgi:hypothetical protein
VFFLQIFMAEHQVFVISGEYLPLGKMLRLKFNFIYDNITLIIIIPQGGNMTQALVYFSTFRSFLLVLAGTTAAGTDTSGIIVGGNHIFPPYEFLSNGKMAGFSIAKIEDRMLATSPKARRNITPA